MIIRPYVQATEEAELIKLTIAAFGPSFEDYFRPTVGEAIFVNQHGDWRGDYRREIPTLHDPEHDKFVAVAVAGDEVGCAIVGFAAWNIDAARRTGEVSHVAVPAGHRRDHVGTALCEHAFGHMRVRGAAVVHIGTGGDGFHAPARALYESLGCVKYPVTVYYRQL